MCCCNCGRCRCNCGCCCNCCNNCSCCCGSGGGSGVGGGNTGNGGWGCNRWDPCAGVRNRAYRRGFNNGYWAGYNDATFGRRIARAEEASDVSGCGSCGD